MFWYPYEYFNTHRDHVSPPGWWCVMPMKKRRRIAYKISHLKIRLNKTRILTFWAIHRTISGILSKIISIDLFKRIWRTRTTMLLIPIKNGVMYATLARTQIYMAFGIVKMHGWTIKTNALVPKGPLNTKYSHTTWCVVINFL